MGTPALRPLGIGEILDAGIKVVLRNWRTLMLGTTLLVLPISIFYVLMLASLGPEQLELIPEETSAEPELPEASVFIGLGLTYIVGILTLLVAYGACFLAVSEAWLGGRPDIKRSLRYGLARAPMIFLLGLVWFGFVLVAWIPCCIPLIWLGVYWSLSMPALLFERIGPFKALGRSYNLIQKRWWASLALLLVCYLLSTIVSAVLQLPLLVLAEVLAGESPVANGIAQGVAYTISFAITFPYYTAVLTILYFDQRVRKEGFDLQLMARDLGVEYDPTAPLPMPAAAPEYTPEQRAAAPYWPPPPGWQPPPPSGWSSPSGWNAPEPPLWGAGGAPAPPERPPDERPPDDSPWMSPREEPGPSGAPPAEEPPAWASPAAEPPSDEAATTEQPTWEPPAREPPSEAPPAAERPAWAPPAEARPPWATPPEEPPSADAPPADGPGGEPPPSDAPGGDAEDRDEPQWPPPDAPRGPSGL